MQNDNTEAQNEYKEIQNEYKEQQFDNCLANLCVCVVLILCRRAT